MILLAYILAVVDSGLIQSPSVSISSDLVRSSSNIQFTLTFPTRLEANDSILLVFPDGLQPASIIRCSVEKGALYKEKTSCSAQGSEVRVSGCFPSNDEIIFTIYGVNTPAYARVTDSFLVYSLNQNEVVVDNLDHGLSLEFFPARMRDAMILVDKNGYWTLTVSTNFEIPELVLIFPNKEIFLGGSQSLYCTQEPRCQNISSNSHVDFEFSQPCICNQNSLNFKGYSSGGNSTLQFQVSAPPSSGQILGFYIYSKTAKGKIEEFYLEAKSEYQGFLNISYQTDSDELGSEANLLLKIICENPIPKTAYFSMKFDGFDVTNVQIVGIYGLIYEVLMIKELNFIKIFDSVKNSLQGGVQIMLLLMGIRNPALANSAEIEVKFQHSEQGVLCSGDIKIPIQPHDLNVSLTVSNSQINKEVNYSFQISSDLLSSRSLITIEFPESISISKATNASIFDFSIHNNLILITSFEIVQGRVDLQLKSIINPNKTGKTSKFSIILYENLQSLVKVGQNQNIFLNPTPGSIDARLFIVSDKVGALTNYIFHVILENPVSAEGFLVVVFPDEVKISSSSVCSQMINIPSSVLCKFSVSQVAINNLFKAGPSNSFQITLTNIKNPLNTCESGSFIIRTYENSFIIDEVTTGVSVLASTPDELKVQGSISSVIVGEVSHFDIKLISSFGFGKSIQVVFPNGFDLTSAFCEKNSDFISDLTCENVSNTSLVLRYVLSKSSQSNFEFSIENIKNPSKTIDLNQISFVSKNDSCEISAGFSTVTINTPSKLSVSWSMSNNLIGSLSNYSFSINYSNPVPLAGYLEIVLPESITITTETYCFPSCSIIFGKARLAASSKIEVFNIKNSENSTISNTFSLSTHIDSALIDSFKSAVFFYKCSENCLECSNLPSFCTSCRHGLFLFNSNCLSECPSGFGLINSNCFECEIQCRSCTSNSSFCIECQEGFAYKGTCVKSCPINQTIQFNSSFCLDCLDSCLTCSESIENCSSCKLGLFLYFGQCLSSCPSGLLAIDGECKACSCSPEKLNNSQCDPECDNKACGYDNFECSKTLSLKSLPSVTTAAGSTVVTAGNKIIGKGEMLGPTVALWTVTQTCSWISFTYQLSKHSNEAKGRRLADDLETRDIYLMFLGILLINLLMNLGFTFAYFWKFSREDLLHHDWMKRHKIFTIFIGFLSAIFSFQLIRLTYTGPSCVKCCRSPFFRVSTISIILMVYTICYSILILAPAITLLVYVLFTFESSHKLYAPTIDCLLLTIIIALTTLFDLVKLSIQIGVEKERPLTASVVPDKERMPDETFEIGKDEIHTERNLRETGMTELNEIYEPEDEDYDKTKFFSLGSVLFNEKFEVVENDEEHQLFTAIHLDTQVLYVLKEIHKDGSEEKGWKIVDSQVNNGKWILGRTVNEESINDIKIWNQEVDKVSAIHQSGYEIILAKSFVGGYLNDFATGTPLYRVLGKDDEKLLIVDETDPSYASLRLDGQVMRVFRSFDKSLVIDVLPKPKNLCEISFSNEPAFQDEELLGTQEKSSNQSLPGRFLRQKLSPLPIKFSNQNPGY